MKKLLLFLLPLLLFACNDPEPITTGSISGSVVDRSSNLPISGVKVTLSPSNQSQTTAADGSFAFSNLDPQTYDLTFFASAYDAETITVTVQAGDTASVTAKLLKIIDPDDPDEPSEPDYSEAEITIGASLKHLEASLVSCIRNESDVTLVFTLTNTYPDDNMGITLMNVNPVTEKTEVFDNLGSRYPTKSVRIAIDGHHLGFGNNIEGSLKPNVPVTCEITVSPLASQDVTYMNYRIYTSTAFHGAVNYSDFLTFKNIRIH